MTTDERDNDLEIAQTSIRLPIRLKRAVDKRLNELKYTSGQTTMTGVIHDALQRWVEEFDQGYSEAGRPVNPLASRSGSDVTFKAPQHLTDQERQYIGRLLEIMRSGYDLAINAVLGNIDAFVAVVSKHATRLRE